MDVTTILVAIFVFGIIIFVHELGHLIFAKKYGILCYEFAVGMGPKLYSKKVGETVYSLRVIPIGGFVSMAGENDDAEDVDPERTLLGVHKLKQAMVIFAGPLFNFLFALLIIFSINLYYGEVEPVNSVGKVVDDSVASELGIEEGYTITQVNGVQIKDFDSLTTEIDSAKASGSLNIVFEKDGNTIVLNEENVDSDYTVGIVYDNEVVSRNIFVIIKNSFVSFFGILYAMIVGFAQLIFDFASVKSNVGGPIMVMKVIGDSAQVGAVYLLQMMALISINIAIINLLPIPGLDGSKILISIGEFITKRDLPKKLYVGLSLGGILFLLLLMVLITIKDIQNLF